MKAILTALLVACSLGAQDFSAQFEEIKRTASPRELYAVLFDLPKGGDLHHHNGLSAFAGTWFEQATSKKTLARNAFYTRLRIANCPGDADPQLHFYNIQRSTWEHLDPCRKAEFEPLASLSPEWKAQWISAMKLDQKGEGRDEFFERIVPRFGDLGRDPSLTADVIAENMRLFGLEGARYIESQMIPRGYLDAAGRDVPPEEADRIIEDRLKLDDVARTGVHIRFQVVVIRFLPEAEQRVSEAYDWVTAHREHWVGINMAGREDNDKGYALRFLPIYRLMRRTHADVRLSIHAGEKDSPGHEVRDTLLLGATRIGHGVNLITDPDTMLLMRNNHYLVEVNLVSNRLLSYVPEIALHPFPEYLRFGIPVCLNTDDRGSWDSDLTDEYFTAVTTFKLSWAEIVQLGRNSLSYSFAEEPLKRAMLRDYDDAVVRFAKRYAGSEWRAVAARVKPAITGYAKRTWGFEP